MKILIKSTMKTIISFFIIGLFLIACKKNSIENQNVNISTNDSLVPQKTIIKPSTYSELLDKLEGTKVYNGTKTLNTKEYYYSNASVKLTSDIGTNVVLDKEGTFNLTDKSLEIWIYSHSNPTTTIRSIYIYALIPGNDFRVLIPSTLLIQNQWINIISSKFDGIDAGSPNWNNIKILRIVVNGMEGQVSEVSINMGLTSGGETKKTMMIMFDDCNREVYDLCFPLMHKRKMVGTIYQISSAIGISDFCKTAELKEMYDNGWDIANHSKSHADLSTKTEQEVIDELEGCKLVLDAGGMTRASRHIAYPYGAANATVLAAMVSWGAKTGRGWGISVNYNNYHGEYPYRLNWAGPSTLSNAKSRLISSINQNTYTVVFHKLTDVWTVSEFEEFLDFATSLGFKTITIDEYYRLFSGPITLNHN
jgi:peptidoglycan/xylan/chitin deacetylase (PgdA/CDA1 family)